VSIVARKVVLKILDTTNLGINEQKRAKRARRFTKGLMRVIIK